MSLKRRSKSEAESFDAVSDDEREVEDTEEEEDDRSSDFDLDMVCLASECAWDFSIDSNVTDMILALISGHNYRFQTCVSTKPGKPTGNVSLLACSHS